MTQSHSMFWRLWLRSLTVKRPQAVLALVSLALGAAVASMLLNLYGDVHRKMTEEFRAYGANVILAPASATTGSSGTEDLGSVMDARVLARLDSTERSIPGLAAAPVLYVVTRASIGSISAETQNVVTVGTDFAALRRVNPGWRVQGSSTRLDPETCAVGTRLAASTGLKLGDSLELSTLSPGGAQAQVFQVRAIVASGASEDDQVFVPLDTLQRLAGLDGKLSLVEVNIPGDARAVENTVREIAGAVPGVDVRAVRQIVSSEGHVLATIRWLLLSLTSLILAIVVLSVISTITVILLERRRDVAVMKSLGASNRMVTRLFLTEVAALGFVGGLIGFGAGALAARDIGRRLFGIALSPDWWMLPVVCAACILAMVLSTALPLGTVRTVDPALVLKGE